MDSGLMIAITIGGVGILGVVVKGVYGIWAASRSARWPRVDGTIVRSEILVNSGDGVSYEPLVEYEYTVGGTTYVGRRIRFGMDNVSLPSKGYAEDWIARFPLGQRTSVAYQPGFPALSVLETGVHRQAFCIPIGLLGLGAFAACLIGHEPWVAGGVFIATFGLVTWAALGRR